MISMDTVQEDSLFKEFVEGRNLRKSTEDSYMKKIYSFCKFLNKTPTELIEEAEKEQYAGIVPRKRKIKGYLLDYVKNLKEKDFSATTISSYVTTIKSFYYDFDIEIPRIRLNTKKNNDRKTNEDIITKKHVKIAMEHATVKHKAMISLAASSGIGGAEIRNLTIGDFLDAISFNKDPFTVDEITKHCNRKTIIPCWHIIRQKTSMEYFTFSTPESTKYILNYLRWRENKNGLLNREKILFDINERKFTIKGFINTYKLLNDRCGFGFKKGGKSRFMTFHGFRAFFASKLVEKGFSEIYAEWLLGHTIPKTTDAYIKPNEESLKNIYAKIVPDLTIFGQTEVHVYESEEYKEIKTKMEKMEKELKKQQFLSAQLESLLERERFNQQDEEVKKEILKGDVKFVKKDEIKAKKS